MRGAAVDPDNPIVKLCTRGMEAEAAGDLDGARTCFEQAWQAARDEYEQCIAAHYVARHQRSERERLRWNRRALELAEAVGDERVRELYPSLLLNLGRSLEVTGEPERGLALHLRARNLLGELPLGRYRDMVDGGIEAGLDRTMASLHEETGAAWDIVARTKYRTEMAEHVALLRAGGDNLLAPERALLAPLLPGARVVHLQCSHGLDALGLLNAGAGSVVGIDISAEMIAQARAKATAVGAEAARFVVADAVAPPEHLRGEADLVYTGRGSLPWILDLHRWATAVADLLRPGGHLFLFEGHPLVDLWDRDSEDLVLRDGAGYFDDVPRENPGFPARIVEAEAGPDRPRMRERHWRPGEVVEALVRVGLRILVFRESPVLFWNQLPAWPEDLAGRLPNSYAILARREAPDSGGGSETAATTV